MIYTLGLQKLPFKQDERQIIYTEGQWNPIVNSFIKRHYEEIQEKAEKLFFDFCYIPYLQEQFSKDKAVKDYYAPYINRIERKKALCNDIILDYLTNPAEKLSVPPMLLFYNRDTIDRECTSKYQYRGFILEYPDYLDKLSQEESDKELSESFSKALTAISLFTEPDRTIFFRMMKDGEMDDWPADDRFDVEAKKLIDEIEERVAKLHQKGISQEVLRRILYRNEKLSRLVITKDKHILLPEYDKEIKLPALPKAVYFLFLRHPEGIAFKYLPDYRKELSVIYEELRHGPLSEREKQSVEDVTDPLMNSINEKCARIREAFISKFDEHLARRYYIDGKRGEPKRVSLPIDLIEWE